MNYDEFFKKASDNEPFPYQRMPATSEDRLSIALSSVAPLSCSFRTPLF